MVLNEKSIDKFRENSDSVFWNWLLDLIFKISRWKSFIAFVLFLAFFEYLFEVFLHIIYCPINNNKKNIAYSHLMIIDPDLLTQMRAWVPSREDGQDKPLMYELHKEMEKKLFLCRFIMVQS